MRLHFVAMNMLEQVKTYLKTANPREVAAKTGLPERYVYKVRSGEIPNPGADRFAVLFAHMQADQAGGSQ